MMTREEAIEVLENGGWWDSLIPVTTIRGRIEDDKLQEAIDLAIATLTPSNEPLTLEQLLEMDGEPVWVVDTTINRREWCYWKGGFAYSCEDQPEYYDQDEYGLWIAYRHPPEGEEDT